MPVQEPRWDLELGGVLDDGNDTFELVRVELTSADNSKPSTKVFAHKFYNHAPLVQIDICLLTNDVGVPPANTLDLSQGVHDLTFSIDVSVQQTENVLMTMRVSSTPGERTGKIT